MWRTFYCFKGIIKGKIKTNLISRVMTPFNILEAHTNITGANVCLLQYFVAIKPQEELKWFLTVTLDAQWKITSDTIA